MRLSKVLTIIFIENQKFAKMTTVNSTIRSKTQIFEG